MSLQLPQDRLDAIVARHAAASAEINTATEATRVVELSRELSELGPVVDAIAAWRQAQMGLAEAEALIEDGATDAELRELAYEERDSARAEIDARAREILIALLPKDAADERNAILEIRAGAINRMGVRLCDERSAAAATRLPILDASGFSSDGFHGSEIGYKAWAEHILGFVLGEA